MRRREVTKFFINPQVVAALAAASAEICDRCLHKHLCNQNCNRGTSAPVIVNGVDALLTTWMILMQARWFRLRFSTTIRQLASWCGTFIRWLPKSSGRIDRVEPPRRTFAK